MKNPFKPVTILYRNVRRYVKTDLPEIINPSSLPDPPGKDKYYWSWLAFNYIDDSLRLSRKEKRELYSDIWREYLGTWSKKKQPRAEADAGAPQPENHEAADSLTSLQQEIGATTSSGVVSLRPLLQQLYRTRVASIYTAYQEAVQNFVEGYREGIAESAHGASAPLGERQPGATHEPANVLQQPSHSLEDPGKVEQVHTVVEEKQSPTSGISGSS